MQNNSSVINKLENEKFAGNFAWALMSPTVLKGTPIKIQMCNLASFCTCVKGSNFFPNVIHLTGFCFI